MKPLSDKEVGELWSSLHGHGQQTYPIHHQTYDTGVGLILTLIEERAEFHYRHGVDWQGACKYACADFGIPWEEYQQV